MDSPPSQELTQDRLQLIRVNAQHQNASAHIYDLHCVLELHALRTAVGVP